MSSLCKVVVHLVFHVKTTSPKIKTSDLNRVFAYLGGIIKNLKGCAICVGGMPDHIHILSTLPREMPITLFVQHIKAESSKWMKTLDPYYHLFQWQEGYGIFSVSASVIPKTIDYIQHQAEHHHKSSFKEELIRFLDAYGIQYDPKYL